MEMYENIRLPWSGWKVTKHIGSGGYGKVYEIERNIAGIQEKAALKIISCPKDYSEIEACYDNGYDEASVIASYEKEIQDYVQEYRLMKELQGQSNIVSCDDFAVVPHEDGIGGDIFQRMELLTSLPQILRQRMLSEQEIIKLGKDISRALMLCESKNIIHRDIKPVNIMISKFGDYKLGDFGVSKIMDHATYATVMGTPEYKAPEVVHMEKYGKAADIYSLGITLYWLLNNRKMPFIDADERLTPAIKDEATKRRYRGEQLQPPRDGSEELKQIVLKACAYRPQNRYTSAKEMYQALEGLGNGMSHSTEHYRVIEKNSGQKTYRKKNYQQSESVEISTLVEDEVTQGNSWENAQKTIGRPDNLGKKAFSEYGASIGRKAIQEDGLFFKKKDSGTGTGDLHFSQWILKRMAIDGGVIKVSSGDNSYDLKIPPGTSDGQKFRLRGCGNPRSDGGEAGDIIVKIHIIS